MGATSPPQRAWAGDPDGLGTSALALPGGSPASPKWRAYAFRIRNLYSDKCLTAARPHASPVYLQNCGDILGQAWGLAGGRTIYSLNYNQTFPLGCPCRALDITNGRNVPGTKLVVATITQAWNQQWLGPTVPAPLR